MKRSVKIVALMLLLVMAFTALVSCSRLSGTYVSSDGTMIVFDGENYTYTTKVGETPVEFKGTYKIKNDGEDSLIFLLKEEQSVDGTPKKLENPTYIGGDNDGTEFGLNYAKGEYEVVLENGSTVTKEYIVVGTIRYTKQ